MLDGADLVASDLRLWADAANGSSQAKAALAVVVSEVARVHSRRLRLPGTEVEEVESRMQASIWSLMATGSSIPRVSLRAWLRFRFLAVVKDYFRETKRVRAIAPMFDEEPQAPGPQAGCNAEQEELRDALKHCLDALPGPQKEAVLRRYALGEDIADAAKSAAGASQNPNTQRVWVFRGITALRDCLRSRGMVA